VLDAAEREMLERRKKSKQDLKAIRSFMGVMKTKKNNNIKQA